MSNVKWEVGQTVDVQSRTWAGINKPGGCARITNVHYTADGSTVDALDIKYVLGGNSEKKIDPAIVSLHEALERGSRRRRGRQFLMERAQEVAKKVKASVLPKAKGTKKKGRTAKRKLSSGPEQSASQPTSPSTPVTPEHPAVAKRTKASNPVASSVPSYVIADHSVEVSPLPLDRSCVPPKQRTVARRGLFVIQKRKQSDSKTSSKETNTAPSDEIRPASTHGQSADATKSTPDMKSSRPQKDAKSTPDMKSSRPQKDAKSTPDMKSSRPQKDTKGVSASAKKQPPAQATHLSIKKAPLPVCTAKEIYKGPSKSSRPIARIRDREKLDRTAVKQSKPKPAGRQKQLKEVFDAELQRARAFIDEVRTAPCNAADVVDTTSKENRLSTSVKKQDRTVEFLSIFRTLRRNFEDGEGTLEETEFRSLVNQQTATPFTDQQLGEQLDLLCQQGKLMKSDGALYIID